MSSENKSKKMICGWSCAMQRVREASYGARELLRSGGDVVTEVGE